MSRWDPSPVNSKSQVVVNERADCCRVADVRRVCCVLPGLVTAVTGTGEINGTKYMNAATALLELSPEPKSSRSVGPDSFWTAALNSGVSAPLTAEPNVALVSARTVATRRQVCIAEPPCICPSAFTPNLAIACV
ncbi:hypothetical protein SBV1_1930068 [Verrucomicrobia bacterium]|nr:hypothetical protein SBV1_1930068 [Verrucomicrobiota bacterium]